MSENAGIPAKLPPIDLEKVALLRTNHMSWAKIAEILETNEVRLRKAYSRSGLAEKLDAVTSRKRDEVTIASKDTLFPQKIEKIVTNVTKLIEVIEDPKKDYLKNASIVVNRVARNLSITETDDARQMAAQSVTLKTINDVAKTVYGLEKNIGESFDFDMSPLLEEALPSRSIKTISEALPETLENAPESPSEP